MSYYNIKSILKQIHEEMPEGTNITIGSSNAFDKKMKAKEGLIYTCFNPKSKPLNKTNFTTEYYAVALFRQLNEFELVEKSNKGFVTRIINLNRSPKHIDIRFQINNEFELSLIAGHLGVKPPIFDERRRQCYFTRKSLPGVEFTRILFSDEDCTQQINVTYALLLALKVQVIDKKIVHRNLNPKNIMIEPGTLEVNIFHYGCGKRVDKTNAEAGQQTDIRSMAKLLSLYWGKNLASFEKDIDANWETLSQNEALSLDLPFQHKWIEPLILAMLTKYSDIDLIIEEFKSLVKTTVPNHEFPAIVTPGQELSPRGLAYSKLG